MELSWDVPTAPIVPIEPGAVNVLQGFSSDQLKSVIEAAQEAAKLQMIEQEKVAAAKKEKHRLRKEKEKEYRIKEKERKLKEREEKERSRAERKEKKLAALDGKLRVPDAEAEDSTATPATPYHADVQSGWTPAQLKSIKNQVYTANVVF
jgi:hydroxymethylpyrimidine pyrophosphatase-like HAD family hydrolase